MLVVIHNIGASVKPSNADHKVGSDVNNATNKCFQHMSDGGHLVGCMMDENINPANHHFSTIPILSKFADEDKDDPMLCHPKLC